MNLSNQKERTAEERRKYIKQALQYADQPLTATHFAGKLSVSRQIIVGDVAILRASGFDILATPKGYLLANSSHSSFSYIGMLACKHTAAQLRDELYTIVDYGATVIDVAIEHAIYGEISGKLDLSSRYDVDLFMAKVEHESNSALISTLTDGVHLHRIGCREKAAFDLIKTALREKQICLD